MTDEKIYKEFNSLEDLEFELLQEINVEDLTLNNDLINKFNGLIEYPPYLYGIVVKVLGDKIIAKNKDYFYLIDKSNYNVGDIIAFKEKNIFKIDVEVFNEKFLGELENKNVFFERINLDDFIVKGEILTKEKLEEEILKKNKMKKQEKEQEKKERQEEEEQEKADKEKQIKDFKEKSIGKFGNYEINKKVIIDKGYYGLKEIFTFKKDVNMLFDYDILKDGNFGYTKISNIPSFEGYLIMKKLDYTKEKQKEGEQKIKLYDLGFEKNGGYPKIKGVRIPQNKLGFILSKIKKEQTEEQIKLLKKLTGIKMGLLDLEDVNYNNQTIDIKISLIDKDNFEVEFMNKTEKFDWEFLKDIFIYGRSVYNSLSQDRFFNFCRKFGLSKQDIFTYVKKLKMLEELKQNES